MWVWRVGRAPHISYNKSRPPCVFTSFSFGSVTPPPPPPPLPSCFLCCPPRIFDIGSQSSHTIWTLIVLDCSIFSFSPVPPPPPLVARRLPPLPPTSHRPLFGALWTISPDSAWSRNLILKNATHTPNPPHPETLHHTAHIQAPPPCKHTPTLPMETFSSRGWSSPAFPDFSSDSPSCRSVPPPVRFCGSARASGMVSTELRMGCLL